MEKQSVCQPCVGHDRLERIDPKQERAPERQHDRHQQKIAHQRPGPGNDVGHRITDQQSDQRRDARDPERVQIGAAKQRLFEQQLIIEERALIAAVRAEQGRIGRLRDHRFRQGNPEHDGEGNQEKHEQPQIGDARDRPLAGEPEGFSVRCRHRAGCRCFRHQSAPSRSAFSGSNQRSTRSSQSTSRLAAFSLLARVTSTSVPCSVRTR